MRRVVSLAGTVFVLVSIVLVLAAFPVGAQDSGGIPPGTAAPGSNRDDPAGDPDTITIASEGCRVAEGASVTLRDDEGETEATFTDNKLGIEITDMNGRVIIKGPNDDPSLGDHATYPTDDTSFSTNGNYEVVSSTGITGCKGGDQTDDGATPPADDGATPAMDDKVGPADDQYDKIDKPGGPPGDVSNPKDVVPDTDVSKKVPVTGGPPLVVLAAVGALLSVALVSGLGFLRR